MIIRDNKYSIINKPNAICRVFLSYLVIEAKKSETS